MTDPCCYSPCTDLKNGILGIKNNFLKTVCDGVVIRNHFILIPDLSLWSPSQGSAPMREGVTDPEALKCSGACLSVHWK